MNIILAALFAFTCLYLPICLIAFVVEHWKREAYSDWLKKNLGAGLIIIVLSSNLATVLVILFGGGEWWWTWNWFRIYSACPLWIQLLNGGAMIAFIIYLSSPLFVKPETRANQTNNGMKAITIFTDVPFIGMLICSSVLAVLYVAMNS
ncbi:MAG: hypothetical protein EBE86_029710 [Hormoscilla sp. GUM202]|nr:hypothetical protein [Hormoscilla sp. GUM202]